MTDLTEATDDELRAEALRRGLILHSQAFSQAAADVIRHCDKVQHDLKALKQRAESLSAPTHQERGQG